ncbi:SRPBCC family protein [Sphaerisporangium rubeum]|uniref:Carbon monoxide dehydrogenase subunit G n=1 Tax=Sphaerisporangium rubeum TaxID=321317 RepID=A0A7X0M4Q7_9ACTN|nr:SRPBCC family protein [Sphaerisporangium rubeum]MBB6471888.1 carbon monoxide dehydrogenase subunit G [Sphaerisporangium rubeum]
MRFEHDFTVPVPVEQAWAVLLDVERVAPCLPGATLDTVEGEAFTGRLKVKVGPITVTYRGQASFTSVDKDGHTIGISASGKEARGTGTAAADVEAALSGEGGWTKVSVRTSFNVTGRPAQFGRGVMAEVGAKLIDRFAANLAALLREAHQPPTDAEIAEGASAGPGTTPFNEPAPLGELAESVASAESVTTPLSEPEAAPARPVPAPVSEPAEPLATPLSEPAQSLPPVPAGNGSAVRHLSAVPDPAQREEISARDAHPAGTARTSLSAEEEALDLLRIAGVPLLKRLAPAVGAVTAAVLLIWFLRRLLTRR